jgi:uncharacterized membrane protein
VGDAFGRAAERFARLFGTPRFIAAQTVVVALWIAFNAVAAASRWDPYPFILLNLVFSTQAAYAAPLILLAATRQADRDKHAEDLRQAADTVAEKQSRGAGEPGRAPPRADTEMTRQLVTLINENTDLTRSIAELTRQVHAQLAGGSAPAT